MRYIRVQRTFCVRVRVRLEQCQCPLSTVVPVHIRSSEVDYFLVCHKESRFSNKVGFPNDTRWRKMLWHHLESLL